MIFVWQQTTITWDLPYFSLHLCSQSSLRSLSQRGWVQIDGFRSKCARGQLWWFRISGWREEHRSLSVADYLGLYKAALFRILFCIWVVRILPIRHYIDLCSWIDFYKKTELPIRLAFFWSSIGVSNIVSSFLAFGILRMRGVLGHEGWRCSILHYHHHHHCFLGWPLLVRWLFLIEYVTNIIRSSMPIYLYSEVSWQCSLVSQRSSTCLLVPRRRKPGFGQMDGLPRGKK